MAECPNPTWNRDVSAAAAPNASVAGNSAAPSSDAGPTVSNTSSMDVDKVAPPPVDVCGVSTPVAPPPAADVEAEDVDQRDNQLDEVSVGSQPVSQSILAGLSVVVSSATMECSEDGLPQVVPPSGFSDCSPLQPSDGPLSSPSMSPMDSLPDVADVSSDIAVSVPPVVAADSSEDSLANVPKPSVPPDPGVQESSSSSPEFVPPLPPRDRLSRHLFR